jgi:hypothetical protein
MVSSLQSSSRLSRINLMRALIAFSALVASSAAVLAQDAGSTCKPLGEADCRKASACRWTAPKALQLPNGKQVDIAGICRFKPGVASALKAAAAQTK